MELSFLKKVYPKHDWKPWFSKRITGRVGKTKKFRLDYLKKWFAKKKKIKKASDWYKLELSDLKKFYARSLTRYHKAVYRGVAKLHYAEIIPC